MSHFHRCERGNREEARHSEFGHRTAPGEWVVAEAIVKDGKLQHLINGQVVIEYTNPKYDDGTPVTHGRISLQAERHPCQFRNIEIKLLD